MCLNPTVKARSLGNRTPPSWTAHGTHVTIPYVSGRRGVPVNKHSPKYYLVFSIFLLFVLINTFWQCYKQEENLLARELSSGNYWKKR